MAKLNWNLNVVQQLRLCRSSLPSMCDCAILPECLEGLLPKRYYCLEGAFALFHLSAMSSGPGCSFRSTIEEKASRRKVDATTWQIGSFGLG